jgi:hypothetical protein
MATGWEDVLEMGLAAQLTAIRLNKGEMAVSIYGCGMR